MHVVIDLTCPHKATAWRNSAQHESIEMPMGDIPVDTVLALLAQARQQWFIQKLTIVNCIGPKELGPRVDHEVLFRAPTTLVAEGRALARGVSWKMYEGRNDKPRRSTVVLRFGPGILTCGRILAEGEDAYCSTNLAPLTSPHQLTELEVAGKAAVGDPPRIWPANLFTEEALQGHLAKIKGHPTRVDGLNALDQLVAITKLDPAAERIVNTLRGLVARVGLMACRASDASVLVLVGEVSDVLLFGNQGGSFAADMRAYGIETVFLQPDLLSPPFVVEGAFRL